MLAQPVATAVRVALRGADRHAGGLRDLLEGVAERVPEQHDLRLPGRDAGERVTELAAQLGHAGRVHRIAVGTRAEILGERLVYSRPAWPESLPQRVDDNTGEPRAELRASVRRRKVS